MVITDCQIALLRTATLCEEIFQSLWAPLKPHSADAKNWTKRRRARSVVAAMDSPNELRAQLASMVAFTMRACAAKSGIELRDGRRGGERHRAEPPDHDHVGNSHRHLREIGRSERRRERKRRP
jgi:hypothetical protein